MARKAKPPAPDHQPDAPATVEVKVRFPKALLKKLRLEAMGREVSFNSLVVAHLELLPREWVLHHRPRADQVQEPEVVARPALPPIPAPPPGPNPAERWQAERATLRVHDGGQLATG